MSNGAAIAYLVTTAASVASAAPTAPIDPVDVESADRSAPDTVADRGADADQAEPAVGREGNRGALLFNFSSIVSGPTAYNGLGLGARYVFSDSLRLRAGLGFGFVEKQVAVADVFNLGLDLGVEFVVARVRGVEIYTGATGQFSYLGIALGSPFHAGSAALTVAGLLGASYFFTDALSLGAEYRIGFTFSENAVGATPKGVQLGVGSVGFILAFWW